MGNVGLEVAEQFRALYETCTQRNPRHRLQDFRTVSDKLFRIRRGLRESDAEQSITSAKFVPELAFALAGLAQEQGDARIVTSRSGRINIELAEPRSEGGFAQVEITLVLGALQIPGTTNERARSILDSRLDRALGDFPTARRRSGDAGTYRVLVEVEDVPMTNEGVDLCRQIIGRAVDSIESL